MIVTRGIRLFITYIKENSKTGELYVGRASGLVDNANNEAADIVRKKRDSSHHRNKNGFGESVIDRISTNSDAIRGREDLLIRKAKELGISGNKYMGISKRNKKKKQYINAAIDLFGDILFGLMFYQILSSL